MTVDADHMVMTKRNYMTVDKREIQLFFKKLRKAHVKKYGKSEIKYYAVAEYGGQFMRPHYHVLIFNCDLTLMYDKKDIQLLKLSKFDGKVEVRLKQWENGHTTVGTITGASVGYSFKYLSKPCRVPQHKNDDRLREFALMSKGLGKSYVEKFKSWHHADKYNRMYCNADQGKKIAMPRYYKQKIYDDQTRKLIGLIAQVKKSKELQKKIDAYDGNYYRDKAEADKASFKRMHHRSTINQKL